MKRYSIYCPTIYYPIVLLFALLLRPATFLCQVPDGYAGLVEVESLLLLEEDDSLRVQLDLRICARALSWRQGWALAPLLRSGDHSLELPRVLINGRQKARLHHRKTVFKNTGLLSDPPYMQIDLPAQTDTLLRYRFTHPYELWMDTACVQLKQELLSCAGRRQLFLHSDLGRVSLAPYIPYDVQPRVNYLLPAREHKQRRLQGQAFLDFAAGRSVIVPGFRGNPQELAKISDVFSRVMGDGDVEITGVYIEGYASIEGSEALNQRLSGERAQALADYLVGSFSLDRGLLRVGSVGEDWLGLRALVEESGLFRKEQILSIIDSSEDADRKEWQLKNLGSVWQTMLTDLFPGLRRVEYQIDFTVRDYSLEESRELAGRNPQMLCQRELFLLARSYEQGSTQGDGLWELMLRQYPEDVTALVNYSGYLLERGEVSTASRYLERVSAHPASWNNLGVCCLLQGDLDQAQEYLQKALAEGVQEAAHNLQEVENKRIDNEKSKRYENR